MKKITICSSIDFTPKIAELKGVLESMGYEVNIPHTSKRILDGELTFEEFKEISRDPNKSSTLKADYDVIKRYYEIIKNSDAILVLNEAKKGINNYIGGNTLMEIAFAHVLDKPIFIYNAVPEPSERMHYVDEILATKPIILNGDLGKIREI